jgi:hypothetical protein
MAKLSIPTEAAAALRVSERMLLFCVASNTDWKHTAIPGEIVTTMVVKGLITRDGISPSPTAGAPCSGRCYRTCDDVTIGDPFHFRTKTGSGLRALDRRESPISAMRVQRCCYAT